MSNSAATRKLNLLIIDDEKTQLMSLRALFRRCYDVTLVSSAENAIDLIENQNYKPQLIICDELMAGIHGIEFLTWMHEQHPEAKCILCTGYVDLASLSRALNEAGIAGYVAKPWDNSELLKLVKRVAHSYQATLDEDNASMCSRTSSIEQLESRVAERTHALQVAHDVLLKQTQDLEIARVNAENANDAKSLFLAKMSHELRSPLNAILLMSQLLANNQDLDSNNRTSASVIHKSGEGLLTLINDLLDMSKAEAGKMALVFEPMSIHSMVCDLAAQFDPQADQRSITLSTEVADNVPELILSDELRLSQIIRNLLSNAFKFTKARDEIKLKVQFDEQLLTFSVEDTGEGIPETKLELIFGAFNQAKTTTHRTHGGTGLGLKITKEFVELFGGTVKVSSKLNEGSCFQFNIPFQAVD
jgi:signal transduction histidine kinase